MKLIILSLILCLSVTAMAQKPFGPSEQAYKGNIFYLELLGGGISSSMKYSGTAFDSYSSGLFIGQTEGLGFRIQSTKSFSYGALFSYRVQGVSFPDENNYLLKAGYLNLYLPFEFSVKLLQSKRKASPAIIAFAGPYAASFLKGNVNIGNSEYELGQGEVNKWDAGIEGGIGLRIPTFSLQGKSDLNLKVSYYYGLLNTYSVFSTDYPQENMDLLLLSSSGSRINHGIRFTISYDISFGGGSPDSFTAGGDGKKTYKRFLNIHN